MRLSIENYAVRKVFGDERAMELIRQAGFDAIDYSFYWMPKGENVLDRDDCLCYAHRLREHADRLGLAITQAHAPFDLNLTAPADKQAYDREQIRRAILFAAILGAEQIIVHNVMPSDPADFFEYNLEFFGSYEQTCREAGIRIAVENLWDRRDGRIVGGRLSSPAELGAFLDRLDPACYCGCIDLGHAQIVGEDPAAFIRALGTPRLHALHVQDTDGMQDSHTLPFLGRHDWKAITQALADVGYDGDMTFEIFAYLGALPAEAIPAALRLAHDVGRRLIADVEAARG